MDDEPNQSRLCQDLIDFLIENGITHYVFSPGARNSPLTLTLLQEEKARLHSSSTSISVYSHFDERGSGFLALGLARSLPIDLGGSEIGTKVALITTSGSAVANLLPALVEAHHAYQSILVITADRPAELHEIGSNQTINQNILTSQLVYCLSIDPVVYQIERGSQLEIGRDGRAFLARVSYALSRLVQGSVQINISFREPLSSSTLYDSSGNLELDQSYSKNNSRSNGARSLGCRVWKRSLGLVPSFPEDLITSLFQAVQQQKGLLIVGELDQRIDKESIQQTIECFKQRGWLILIDLLSGISRKGRDDGDYLMFHEFLFKYAVEKKKFLNGISTIVHFGGKLVSKWVVKWIASSPIDYYLQIDDQEKRYDPAQKITRHLQIRADFFCQRFIEVWKNQMDHYQAVEEQGSEEDRLSSLISSLNRFQRDCPKVGGELKIACELGCFFQHLIDREMIPLVFLGNSMPIRDFSNQVYWSAPRNNIMVYGNRGASGIDGLIATSIGIALGNNHERCYSIIGDLSFLHDLNSLALLSNLKTQKMTLIVINNQEGTIFNFLNFNLPASQTTDSSCSEDQLNQGIKDKFLYRHGFSFKSLAQLFSLSYHLVEEPEILGKLLADQTDSKKHHLIEIKINSHSNFEAHRVFEDQFNRRIDSLI